MPGESRASRGPSVRALECSSLLPLCAPQLLRVFHVEGMESGSKLPHSKAGGARTAERSLRKVTGRYEISSVFQQAAISDRCRRRRSFAARPGDHGTERR